MYIRYTKYSCPHCGNRWATRIATAPRIGREVIDCRKCHQSFGTHDLEWLHMSKPQKLSYVFEEGVVALAIFYGLFFLILPSTGREQWAATLTVLIGVGIVMFGSVAFAKFVAIRKSIRRVNESGELLRHAAGQRS
jgi:hypothetical protein